MIRYEFNTGWKCNGKEISIPHDAMITGERKANNPGGSALGFFTGGEYLYEKRFTLPEEWIGKKVKLQFEGVYKNAKVSVNGKELGGISYGYIPFWIDCGILPEGENAITVACENLDQPDSRWYSGAGIYRPVWAWVGDGITAEDIQIQTISISPATISVNVDGNAVAAEIWDEDKMVASGTGVIEIPEAKLWSDESPYLYTCRVADQKVNFGIREITWSNQGLFINGKETLLRGGCIHHDNGILGAATYDESEWRRVRMLKEAGYNALRSSHNPCSRAMLEACDYYGMYLMDETWDMWYSHKNPYDYASDFQSNWEADVEAMVARDYNHPSVIFYSIANEVSEPATEKGVQQAKAIVEKIHSLDSSRPVTGGYNLMIISRSAGGNAVYNEEEGGRDTSSEKKTEGMNSLMFNVLTSMVGTGMNKGANSKKADAIVSPVLDSMDIAGYNYASGRYPLEGKEHPERVIFGSETFPQDIAKNWAMVKKYPYLIGDFMWTAWDYLGEAGAGAWAYSQDGKGFEKPYPWLLADIGVMDILGNPNGELHWAQAVWGLLEKPQIAVQPVNHSHIRPAKSTWRGTNAIPSWSWQGCEGKKAIVEVYYDCVKLELLLNGKSIGKKRVKECRAIFKTKYVPGKLEAVAYDAGGNEVARNVLATASQAEIWIQPEKAEVSVGEILYIPITIGDGVNFEANADKKLTVEVEGGELLAFGSANPRTEETYHSGSFTSYYGRALAIVKATDAGMMQVQVNDKRVEILVKE